ncbi:MAG: response regulator [Alphaproteobacteria bacterium]|nr:response regulator [Alphaproteobacteria bacterium]
MTQIRVLLIEDDPADARLVERMLRLAPGEPFVVETTDRLAGALGRIAQGGIVVVLADLSLPDSAGLGTLTALTQAAPDLPVVVLTGNDDDSQAIEALKYGAQDYLVKGTSDGAILTRVVRYAIERKATERALKDALDKAEAAVRAKSLFLATIGHEIRTPLNGILGMTRLLLDNVADQRQRTFAETIESSAELLLGLVNDILDFSRLEADGLTLEELPFDVSDMVEELRLMMAPRAAEKGLTLGCRIPAGLPPLLVGDPLRLRQVLLNLVGNAIKFTERGSVIIAVNSEMARPDGLRWLRMSVIDTGMGIAQAAHSDLFVEFTQADSSYTRRFGGAGLGLAICKKLVTLMGGEIGFDSAEGAGATFWFTVPLKPASDEHHRRRDSQVAMVQVDPRRIMLVDDNPVNREVAVGLLERHGHTVTAFPDGWSAVQGFHGVAWDLILLDMHMPEMDGLETARGIRAEGEAGQQVPIWLLTANPLEQDSRLWRDAGIDGCLSKPFRVEEIAAVLVEGATHRRQTGERGAATALVNLPDFLADQKDLGADRMRSLVDLFRSSSGKDLAEITRLAEAGQLAQVGQLIHRMASAASSLHMGALAQRCRALENAARADDAVVLDQVGELAGLWERSLQALDEIIR